MQVPRGVHLRPEYAGELLCVHCGEQAVGQHARGVDDTGQRVLRRDVRQHRVHRGSVGGVTGDHLHLGAEGAELFAQLGRAGRGFTASARQHQPPYAVHGDQVPCEDRAEAAGATGDQHGAVGPQRSRRR